MLSAVCTRLPAAPHSAVATSCRRPGLGGKQLSSFPAPALQTSLSRSQRRSCPPVCAATDSETDFSTLAKKLTGALASELASNDDGTYKKLESWLAGNDEEHTNHASSNHSSSGTGAKLMSAAADHFGVPSNVSDAVHSVQSWLSNPKGGEEAHDSHMVGRIVQRLLSAYQSQAGEEFRGHEEGQWDKLYAIGKTVLGSSISRSVLKSLVQAYLNRR